METCLAQTVDIPANSPQSGRIPPLAYRFTKANAKEMAARANQARLKREQAAKRNEEIIAKTTPQSVQISEELERLLGLMKKTKDADTLQKLSAARSRLFAEWQTLTGTPNPGARRSGKRDKPPAIQPEPMPAQAPAMPATGLENG